MTSSNKEQVEAMADARSDESANEDIGRTKSYFGPGLFWGLLTGAAMAVGIGILALSNTYDTTVEFLQWEFSLPVIVLILGSVVVGALLNTIYMMAARNRRQRVAAETDELNRLRYKGESWDRTVEQDRQTQVQQDREAAL